MLRSISEVFTDLEESLTGERIEFGAILESLREQGYGFPLLIFSAPMALPVPTPPGINILLAIPLMILSAQQAVGQRTIWFPAWVKRKSIKRETLGLLIRATVPWFRRIEKLVKPRMEFATQGIFSHLIGLIGLIMALMVCVPIPMTNTIPSLGIALMAIGVIMRDGLCVTLGAIISFIWAIILTAIIGYLGVKGIDFAKDMIDLHL